MDDDSAGDNLTDDEWQPPKRLALHDSDIPRYEKEFIELSLIGRNINFCVLIKNRVKI